MPRPWLRGTARVAHTVPGEGQMLTLTMKGTTVRIMDKKKRIAEIVLTLVIVLMVLTAARMAQGQVGSSNYTPNQVRICQGAFVTLVHTGTMSRRTADRKALELCKRLQREDGYFFRAIVRNPENKRRMK